MPKLVIKQEAGVVAQQSSVATWLSAGGLLALLAFVAAAFYFTRPPPLPGAELEPLAFTSASNENAQTDYQSLYAILGDLMTEYESLALKGADGHQKNLMLQGKAESLLGHLNKMDTVAQQLGLNAKESGEVGNRHQFYKDFWQAKLHFRELRVSRFKQAAPSSEVEQTALIKTPKIKVQPADTETATNNKNLLPEAAEVQNKIEPVANAEEQPKKPKFQFAQPPEGMALPAGFCDLGNADSCKPGEEAVTATHDSDMSLELPEVTEADMSLELPLPEVADTDMSLELPEVTEADMSLELPLPEVADADMSLELPEPAGTVKKPTFQFAKPPEGMALPAGFCDLSDGGSCKPEGVVAAVSHDANAALELPEADMSLELPAMTDADMSLELPLPEVADTDMSLQLPEPTGEAKKSKFQFAKPPEGMELPAGFCDLSNPGSCKPEGGDLLSDADQPAGQL